MNPTHIILVAIIAATSVIQAATAEHKLPAPLPEFKTPEQLAKWSEEMPAKAAAADALAAKQVNSDFYTGKPFLKETGSYVFKFRQYDPELSRWTSADPSGFRDGSNLYILGGNPLNGFDRLGLWYDSSYTSTNAATDFTTASVAVNAIGAAGFTIAERFGDYSLSQDPTDYTGTGSYNNPATRTAASDEKQLLKTNNAFTSALNANSFKQYTGHYEFTQLVTYSLLTNIGLAYGRVMYTVSGDVVRNGNMHSTNALFTFDDRYDFDVNNPAYAAFARLQYHDITYNYINSGEFSNNYTWE